MSSSGRIKISKNLIPQENVLILPFALSARSDVPVIHKVYDINGKELPTELEILGKTTFEE